MVSKTTSKPPVGVIGAGSFGTAMANLLAEKKNPVLLYARTPERAEKFQKERIASGQKLDDLIEVTNDIEKVTKSCSVIFPIIPSANFR
ncbi:MAG: NAD(P)-binding domain-containing protein, partial [Cyclobacteriaceae bacterium]